tara:strand:- start:55828 stop:56262 length:435 start_codon:yes stop_codon:yes gene_type:complete
MLEFTKILGLLVFSTLRFFFSPSAALLAGHSFLETIAITVTGGYTGFVIFFFGGKFLVAWWHEVFKPKKKKLFNKRNRLIVKIKSKYGLMGIAILTPLMLSIPVGALLGSYYFPRAKITLPVFFVCLVIWSFILTSFWSLFIDS